MRQVRRKAVEKNGFKSKFEATFAALVAERATYETSKLKFIEPEKHRTYTPDWTVNEYTFIEQKGYFTAEDRNKMLLVRDQHPDKKFYMLFMNPHAKIHKNSQTTYAEWCDKHNFVWASLRDKEKWNAWINRPHVPLQQTTGQVGSDNNPKPKNRRKNRQTSDG